MARRYGATVPTAPNVKKFQYNGKTYGAGNTLETDNACEVLGFFQAFRAANPQAGKKDATPDAWKTIEFQCNTAAKTAPVPAPPSAPLEANPSTVGGDSADNQGAPKPATDGIVASMVDDDQPSAPSAGDEPTRPPNGEPHATHGGDEPHTQSNTADPVDLFSGAFIIQETDLEIPNTVLPLSFQRIYRSGLPSFGPLGWNWDHNFNVFIRELSNGDIAVWRNMHEDIFTDDGSRFEPPRGVFEKLTRIAGFPQTFEIACDGGTVLRFERPIGWLEAERIPLIRIRDRHGNLLVLSYHPDGSLSEVRDNDGRYLKMDYDACGLLVAVSDEADRRYEYRHDEQAMQLTQVKTPPTTDHPGGIVRSYDYERQSAPPELRHNVVRVQDAKGNVYLENTYETDPASWSYARLVEQSYGGHTFQFRYTQLQWVSADPVYINIPAVQVEVLNPEFSLETYTFNYRGDLLDRRHRLNKDKSFRVVVWKYSFDEQGNLSVVTYPDGSEEIDTYDFASLDPRMRGKPVKKELTAAAGYPAPSRIVWQAEYEPVYQLLTEEEDEVGGTTRYYYDLDLYPGAPTNSGKLLAVHKPEVTLPDGTTQTNITEYEYDGGGRLRAEMNPVGIRFETVYGTAGVERSRPIRKILDVGGLDIENRISYDASGYERAVIDGNGNATVTIVNTLGLIETTILPPVNGVLTQYRLHYDTDRRVVRAERPKGSYADGVLAGDAVVDVFERDVLGYPTRQTFSSNTAQPRTQRISTDFRGIPIEMNRPDGSQIRRTYDERGLLISEVLIGSDGSRLQSRKTYNRRGKLLREIDPAGTITHYAYDGFARLSQITLPNQTQINYHWLPGDLLGSEEVVGDDGFGATRRLSLKTYTYDRRGRRVTQTSSAFRDNPSVATNVTRTTFFDPADRIERVVDHRGGITTFRYDALGRVTSVVDPMGNEYRNRYDPVGNTTAVATHHIEPDGSTSIHAKRYTYDERNRLVGIIEPDGAVFTQHYDDRNLVVTQIDLNRVRTEVAYDSFNNRIRQTLDVGGLNIMHQWRYDAMDRLISYIDPSGQTSTYIRDGAGRPAETQYPNGFSSQFTYNSAGQLVHEILGNGVELEYAYDAANRLSRIENSTSPPGVQMLPPHVFAYDGADRVVSAALGANRVERRYDSEGRLLSEETRGSRMACRYDDLAGTVEKTWPDGRTERYSHNLNGITTRIEETAAGGLGSGLPLIVALTPSGPDAFGEATYPAGITVTNLYDQRRRLTQRAVTSPADLGESVDYRYDVANRIQAEALSGHNPKLAYLEHDHVSRLTTARDGFAAMIVPAFSQSDHDNALASIAAASAGATHTEEFSYGVADERGHYAESGLLLFSYSYLAGHRIDDDGADTFTYHGSGTLRSDGTFAYDVDALGRITAVSAGGVAVCEIEYDAFGRPSEVRESGLPAKAFHYLGGFVEQEDEGGIPARQISMHPVTGIPAAYHTAAGTLIPLFDNRFNLTALADVNGGLVSTYRYHSFGLPAIYDAAGIQTAVPPLGIEPTFGGERYVTSCGLYLSRSRLMNPRHGVFLSADPSGYADSASLYVYAAQNPFNRFDPTGEVAPLIAAVVIAGALVGAGLCIYDAYNHPEKYGGAAGIWKPLASTFGGAAIGSAAALGGEVVLGAGGVGSLAGGMGATTLTTTQTFLLYGTSSTVAGGIGRAGFNQMFPDYVDPVSAQTLGTDFIVGGGLPMVGPAVKEVAAPLVSGSGQILTRALGGNWRVFGNTWKLLRNPRVQFDRGDIFWNPKAFSNVSKQYWRASKGADGKALHHIWFQNQSTWVPQGLRNAGFNLLEIPGSLNTWMGGRLGRELAFRGIVMGLLAGTGYGSAKGTSTLLDYLTDDGVSPSAGKSASAERQPNEMTQSK